ncbi:Aste57867_21041 [Aphanomyces stellatus]|uniref:Aste57867_21041 protein n=1 Tax=Aphanomyces stellatus TaxID=120398 RepID=A0A485LHR3_9STRA|nr:hypothetical protein As57867_020973 [Aphanomyces stellatus]VFT97716.1 Aste57867_21041 [Aphanomyces stellatus]
MLATNGKITASAAVQQQMEALPKPLHDVMGLLDHVLRVEITDGRIVVGLFHSLDRDQNLILTDSTEYRFPEESSLAPSVRSLGMTLIPGRHVLKISKQVAATA